MCGRSQGTAANCTACVTSWKITQSASSSWSTSIPVATASRFGPTKSSRGGTDGSSSDELVLAEHALADEAEQHADLRRRDVGHARPRGPGQDAEALADTVQQGVEQRAGGSQVRGGPAAAVDPLGRRQRRRRLHARDLRDALRGALGARVEPLGRRRALARAAGEQQREALGELRIDHGTIPASSARPCSVRAATTGECGSRSSGAPSGVSQAVNATWPPLSRTMSCAAATSTARHRHSVSMPSTRASATWHIETAIVPMARMRLTLRSRPAMPCAM